MKLGRIVLLSVLSSTYGGRDVDRGLNLPPTQGTTRDGAFFQGLYQYDYHPDQVARAAQRAGFSALRLAVNVETANNAPALQKHKAYIDAVGGRGIICMFDTSTTPGGSWPRSGTVTEKLDKVAEAWQKVHAVFAPYGDSVMYEIFNEPWGYKTNVAAYVQDMTSVIQKAGLPENRVILAGLHGSADVQSVVRAGWPGYLAFHTYVFWLPEGQRTEENFSKRLQQDLAGISSKVFITEFGVGLDGLKADIDEDELKQDIIRHRDFSTVTSDWHDEHPEHLDIRRVCEEYPDNAWCRQHYSLAQKPSANLGADVVAQLSGVVAPTVAQSAAYQNDTMAFLRGMRSALLAFKRQGAGVRGLYHWHGWHNGDTWDFWDAANARSSRMIQMMMMDQGEGNTPQSTDTDPFMSEDFVQDAPGVHMMLARQLGPQPSAAECPKECGAKHCLQGNEAQIGGKHLTGNFCTHNCSKLYGEHRYCGVGPGYQEEDAIDCGGCASPLMCSGLPCWTQAPRPQKPSHSTFLQKRFSQVQAVFRK